MFIIIAIILCFAISFYVKEILWKQDIQKVIYTAPETAAPVPAEKPVKIDIYKDAEFVNKHSTHLDDFIINNEINEYDLMKLADLNGIPLHIRSGWYPITLELIKELGALGWNKKVTCIKEKYASLRFYADYPDYELFEKYEKLSEHICETCGERGEIRYGSGWDYTACRKHYLEHRPEITVVSDMGFIYDKIAYNWDDVLYVFFEGEQGSNEYRRLSVSFNKSLNRDSGTYGNKLYISSWAFGYGNFLAHLPESIRGVDIVYVKKYREVAFCEICGYKAVYNGECECCENETYNHRKESFRFIDETRVDYIGFNQMCWTLDEGEKYEQLQGHYEKTKYHKILYTEDRLNEFKNAGDE